MKTLILRFSSLGDIVLASTTLGVADQIGEAFRTENLKVDWLLADEFAPLLEGDTRIRKLWRFKRNSGLFGLIKISSELWKEDYDLVLDLHSSVRTHLIRIFFITWGVFSKRKIPVWKKIKKQRLRFFGFYLFKNLWPTSLKPEQKIRLFSPQRLLDLFENCAQIDNHSRLTESQSVTATLSGKEFSIKKKEFFPHVVVKTENPVANKQYYCVMPSSRWKGKCWSTENYYHVIQSLFNNAHLAVHLQEGVVSTSHASPLSQTFPVPVILGTHSDEWSVQLVQKLENNKIPHLSGIGKWTLQETAAVLADSLFYLGNDTGFAHLAEAVGVPVFVLFGPTVPEMGFRPWRAESKTLGHNLWCRPCGKDGRFCFRPIRRHYCMTLLKPEKVLMELETFFTSFNKQKSRNINIKFRQKSSSMIGF